MEEFAVSADHIVKREKGEGWEKYLDLAQKLKGL